MTDRIEPSMGNDYAVAKAFNECVLGMFIMIILADLSDKQEDADLNEMNRAYILVVNELESLYARNPKLAEIQPEPIWKLFDVLKTATFDILDYLDDPVNDVGQAHIARVEKLCILAGSDPATFTPEQQKLFDNAESARIKFGKITDQLYKEKQSIKLSDWQIPQYTLNYKPDGTILINNVMRLKKAHAGSTTERLLEQSIRNPNKLFMPELGQTSRNISTILSGAGFTRELRQIFFPTVSTSNGILFRPIVSRREADNDKIDTTEIDIMLKDLGATIESKSIN